MITNLINTAFASPVGSNYKSCQVDSLDK